MTKKERTFLDVRKLALEEESNVQFVHLNIGPTFFL